MILFWRGVGGKRDEKIKITSGFCFQSQESERRTPDEGGSKDIHSFLINEALVLIILMLHYKQFPRRINASIK